MTIYHQKAIQLKYEGQTYRQISQAIGGKISAGTLQNYFSDSGMLRLPYLEYEARQNHFREGEVRNDFKRQASYASKIMNGVLQKALKKGDMRLVFDILKEQLDRAGIVSVQKKEMTQRAKGNTYREPKTEEEMLAMYAKGNIDPTTGMGLRPGFKEMTSEIMEENIQNYRKYVKEFWEGEQGKKYLKLREELFLKNLPPPVTSY